MAESFIAPQSVADNARMALDVRESKPASQQGMTAVGLARANQLANRQSVSLETVQRMVAYFDRHEIDKQGSTWDEKGKGWQAWNGWGGDEGRVWANRILMENKMTIKASRRHSESDMESLRMAAHHTKQTMKALRSVGYDGVKPKSATKAEHESIILNERQIVMYDMYESIVEEYGSFDQGIGANGAHYGAGDLNPFMEEGIMCASCVFYMEGKCEIVQGDIDPEGICKLWIIPESALNLINAEEIPDEMPMEEMTEDGLAMGHEDKDKDAMMYMHDEDKDKDAMMYMHDDDKDAVKTASLDDNAIMNAEAIKRYVRRLLGVK